MGERVNSQRPPDFDRLFEQSTDGYFRFLFDDGFAYVSPGFERLAGRTSAQLLGRVDAWEALIAEGSRKEFEAISEQLRSGEIQSARIVIAIKGQARRTGWAEMFAVPVEDAQGRIVGMDAVVRDVSEHLEVADLLSRRSQEQAALLAVQRRFLSQFDLERTMEQVVQRAVELLGTNDCALFVQDAQAESLRLVALAGKDGLKASLEHVPVAMVRNLAAWSMSEARPTLIGDMSQNQDLADRYGWELPGGSVAAVPLTLRGRVTGAIVALSGPNELGQEDLNFLTALAQSASLAMANSQSFREVERLAATDGLTGAYNRLFFEDNIGRELERARRMGYSAGLLIIDVDELKDINDRHGHVTGDEVLRAVVRAVRDNIRETDWVARYGGDEFAIVLPGCGSEGLRRIGEKVVKALQESQVVHDGQMVKVGVSVGGAVFPDSIDEAEGLLQMADRMERQAKRSGGDRIVIHKPGTPGRPATVDQSA